MMSIKIPYFCLLLFIKGSDISSNKQDDYLEMQTPGKKTDKCPNKFP
jgi:hypothetical protein